MRCPALILQPLYLTSFSALPNMFLYIPMSRSAQLAKTRPQKGHIWPQGHLTPKYFSVPHLVAHQQNPQQLRGCQSNNDRARARKRKRDENCLF